MTKLLTVGLTAIIAFVVTVLLGMWLIPRLKKLNFGQTILEIGPRWHKDKQGTPTMGGLSFIFGISIATAIGFLLVVANVQKDLTMYARQNNPMLFVGLFMAVLFGIVGIADDFIKIRRKDNEGLTEKQKLVLQIIIAVFYISALYVIGERSTIVWIPFVGQLDFGLFYYPIMVLGIVFIVNVVNFTDGIDGLCGSVTMVAGIGFLAISNMLGFDNMEVLSAALIGGCMGYLVWNIYPAKLFMGDTGSLFLGGIIIALIFGLRIPAIIVIMGLVYIIEGVTVIIQTTYFKYTRRKTGHGKRLFKMTPIHHHFEMSGWSENKIVIVFSLVQLVCCVVAVIAVRGI